MAEVNMPKPVAHGERGKAGLDRKVRNLTSGLDGIGDTLLYKIFIPGIRNLLQQAGHGVVDGIFGGRGGYDYRGSYGYSSYGRPSYEYGRGGRTDYAGRSRSARRDEPFDEDFYYQRHRRRNDPVVGFRTWSEAEDVKDGLAELLEARPNHYVTISDLNYLADMDDRDDLDSQWGWYDVSMMRVRIAKRFFSDGSDGYVLDMPSPVYIDIRR